MEQKGTACDIIKLMALLLKPSSYLCTNSVVQQKLAICEDNPERIGIAFWPLREYRSRDLRVPSAAVCALEARVARQTPPIAARPFKVLRHRRLLRCK